MIAPWQVVRIRDDLGKNQIDVWIGQPTGKANWFFGAKSASVADAREQAWRHVNLGDTRCVVHAEAGGETAVQHWQGEIDQPFTPAMSRQIVAMIRAGITLQSVCAILDITVGGLWKVKYGLDSGRTGLSPSLAAASAEKLAADSRVPEPVSAVWAGLLDGSIHIDSRLPLVADYCGAMINVSIKSVDAASQRVDCYAPVFAAAPSAQCRKCTDRCC